MQSPSSRILSAFPTVLRLSLLLVLTFRLTISETPRSQLSERLESLAPAHSAVSNVPTPQPGPAVVVAVSLAVLLVTSLTPLVTPITKTKTIQLIVIAGILTLAVISAYRAAAPYPALIGVFDLAAALLAFWSLSLLANTPERRRLVLAALIGLMVLLAAKGLYQYFSEFPDNIRSYQEYHKDIWAEHHWSPGDVQIKLLEARLNSRAVTGFFFHSDIFAAALLPLLLITLALVVELIRAPRDEKPEASSQKPENSTQNTRRPSSLRRSVTPPLPPTTATDRWSLPILLALLFLAGTATLFLTRSKGATSAFVLFTAIVLPATLFPAYVARHRRRLLAAGGCFLGLLTLATLAYGLTFHALPTKTLLFRWHYWTASVPIIQTHPLLGVGLNNFGDYYGLHKLPVSPEDVKDPHSYFIRLAAEIGLPATILLAALLLHQLIRTLRQPAPSTAPSALPPSHWSLVIGHWPLFLLPLLWLFLHVPIADPPDLYFLLLDILFTLIFLLGLLLAAVVLNRLPARSLRPLILAGLAGAAAMFLYDQVNMALVTGPVAMLFWILLALAEPEAPFQPSAFSLQPSPSLVTGHWSLVTIPLLLLTLFLTITVYVPTTTHSFSWDTTPDERRALAAINRNDTPAAIAAVDHALTLDRRSVDLVNWRIHLKLQQHQSTADDIRKVFDLNPTSRHLYISLASLPSDLPVAERRAALQHALWLDDQLPPDEIQRLTPAVRAQVQQQIDALK